jgi:hypothetical protein
VLLHTNSAHADSGELNTAGGPEPSAGAARRQDLVWSGQVGRIGSVSSLDPAFRRSENEGKKKRGGIHLGRARVSVTLAVYPAVVFISPFTHVCHSACAS